MDFEVDIKTLAVTVYPSQARVTVGGQVTLESGNHRLMIDDLPLGLLTETLRVSGRGEATVRILGVDVQRIHYEETPAEELRQLANQIEELEGDLLELADQEATLEAQLKYLDGLRSATKQYARALSRGKTDAEYQLSLTNFFREQDQQHRSEVRELSKKRRIIERKIDKLREELKEYDSALPKTRHRAAVDVEVNSAGAFFLEVNYVVKEAYWKPLYDVRLLSSTDEPELELTSLAQVQQETGQEWNDVALTISTARPAINQRKPSLKPWYIGPPEAVPLATPAIRRATMAAPQVQAAVEADTEGMRLLSDVAEYETARPALAEAQITDLSVSFKVTGRTDIPSDGSPRKLTLAQHRFEPELDYLTVPKHTSAVFRRVKAVNSDPGPLLAGRASLFSEEDYVGDTELEFVPADGEFELLLGVEDGISVERELIQRDVDKVLLRDRRQLVFGQKIELKNFLSTEIKIEVQDQIPVARHEEIKVKLVEVEPQPSENTELNILTWELIIPSDQEQVIQYAFRIDHPRNMRILGLGRN